MFSSLRTRLWLSYALLILLCLCVVGAGLLLALSRNPPAYRQAVVRLRAAEAGISADFERLNDLTTQAAMETAVRRESLARGVRVIMLAPDGTLLADSRGLSETAAILNFSTPLTPNDVNLAQLSTIRDSSRRVWWYTLRSIANGNLYLVVAMQRPALLGLAEFSAVSWNEVFVPLLGAAGLGLLLAFLLAFGLERWIAAPLQRIAASAKAIANRYSDIDQGQVDQTIVNNPANLTEGKLNPIPLEGPREVQDLANAINEMNRKVQLSQQSQREFVANVSHELKTPLTSIQGFAQAILDGATNTPEALNQAGQVILGESGRMYRLVMDLLTLARLDAGTADLHLELVDLGPLLQGVVTKFLPLAHQSQINLQCHIEALPEIRGDGDRLAQVFGNLVDNALKYTPQEGQVWLRAQPEGNLVVVRVADSGVGIAPDDLSRIFERFYRTDKSRQSGPNRGAGLGLAIARQLVQAQGGTISAASSLGHGSEFTVRFPISHLAETVRAKPDKRL